MVQFVSLHPAPKPHPILASFIAAAIVVASALLLVVFEISATPSGVGNLDAQPDSAAIRSAAVGLFALPFLYVIAVPVCYAVGTVLVKLRLHRFMSFMSGATVFALMLGGAFGTVLASHSRPDELTLTITIATLFVLLLALPAASCWWLVAVRSYYRPGNPDLSPRDNTT